MKLTLHTDQGEDVRELPDDLSITYGQYMELALLEGNEAIDDILSVIELQVVEPSIELNPAADTWEKIERCKIAFKDNEGDFYKTSLTWAKIYTDNDISILPACEGLAIARYTWNKVNIFFDKFKELGNSDATPQEQQAAIDPRTGKDCFEDMGYFATLYTLSGGDATQYDAWLKLPAIRVYRTLLMRHRIAGFTRRHSQIVNSSRK